MLFRLCHSAYFHLFASSFFRLQLPNNSAHVCPHLFFCRCKSAATTPRMYLRVCNSPATLPQHFRICYSAVVIPPQQLDICISASVIQPLCFRVCTPAATIPFMYFSRCNSASVIPSHNLRICTSPFAIPPPTAMHTFYIEHRLHPMRTTHHSDIWHTTPTIDTVVHASFSTQHQHDFRCAFLHDCKERILTPREFGACTRSVPYIFKVNILRQDRISNCMSTCQKLILNATTDRHSRVENKTFLIYSFWCKLGEIQPFKGARTELRLLVYACDLWWNINPGVMLSLFLKHLQVILCTFCFFWSLGTISG